MPRGDLPLFLSGETLAFKLPYYLCKGSEINNEPVTNCIKVEGDSPYTEMNDMIKFHQELQELSRIPEQVSLPGARKSFEYNAQYDPFVIMEQREEAHWNGLFRSAVEEHFKLREEIKRESLMLKFGIHKLGNILLERDFDGELTRTY